MTRAAAVNLLSEFAPVLAFFIAGQFYDFFTATAILLGFTVVSLAATWIQDRSIAFFPIFSGVLVIGSGLITLYFKAPDALIFSDTLYYFAIAGVIGVGLPRHKYFLKWIFQRTFAMADIGWEILSYRWMYMFVAAGIGNEIVRIFLTPEVWVDYKFVKVLLLAGFGFYQFTLSRRYRLPDVSNEWGLRIKKDTEV